MTFFHAKQDCSDLECTLCDANAIGDLTHSLITCSYNGEVGQFLLDRLHHVLPNLLPHQVILLNFDVEHDKQLPLVNLIALVLSRYGSADDRRKHASSIQSEQLWKLD